MRVGEGACVCFWMEPLGRERLGLRRFTFSDDGHCPGGSNGHDASVVLADVEFETRWNVADDGYRTVCSPPEDLTPARDDPRWPTRCATCGEEFPEGAEWQVFGADGYRRSDSGEAVWARHILGVEWAGALYHMAWLEGRIGLSPYEVQDRGDGIILAAVCPNGGLWVVDGRSSSGGYWTRTGDPRRPETLSASPSIVCGRPGEPGTYHGFLTNGNFTAHIG